MFEQELRFTQTYKQNINAPIAIREALCLMEQFPAVFAPMQQDDLLAGRLQFGWIGFGLEGGSGGTAGYGMGSEYDSIVAQINQAGLDDDRRRITLDAVEFWHKKESIVAKHLAATPQGSAVSPRLAGVFLNYDKLLNIGLPGLVNEIELKKQQAQAEGKDGQFFEGMLIAMGILSDVCREYSENAKKLMELTVDEKQRKELKTVSEVLERITVSKPSTLREAIQLFWLYSLVAGVVNYGRVDVFLGDFYARDIDTGLLSENEALELLKALWQLIADRKIIYNGRVIIGGKGRRNVENADRFALAAMEATRLIKEVEPQLTLRFHAGMNPRLMEKALDVIGEGRVYPMLYNDDVNVAAVRKAFGISREEAEQYLPYGCGEYAIDHASLNSPNCALNLLKMLEYALHNGRDGLTGEVAGVRTGKFSSFNDFEDLFDAYKRQVEYQMEALAKSHAVEYEVERNNASYLYASALFDDCIQRGKSMVDGGARYLGGLLESFAIVNVSDSLAAIKQSWFMNRNVLPKNNSFKCLMPILKDTKWKGEYFCMRPNMEMTMMRSIPSRSR